MNSVELDKFYHWLQRELERDLKSIYKIHNMGVFRDQFCIWFLNNSDSISISLDEMQNIYNNRKSMEKLTIIIEAEYLARIKK